MTRDQREKIDLDLEITLKTMADYEYMHKETFVWVSIGALDFLLQDIAKTLFTKAQQQQLACLLQARDRRLFPNRQQPAQDKQESEERV